MMNYIARQVDAILEGERLTKDLTSHLLPEKAQVLINGVKKTADVSKGLKQVIGH